MFPSTGKKPGFFSSSPKFFHKNADAHKNSVCHDTDNRQYDIGFKDETDGRKLFHPLIRCHIHGA